MHRDRRLVILGTLLAVSAAVPRPAAAQQDTAAAPDTTLLAHAARMARTKFAEIVGPAGLTDQGSALYRSAQGDMASGGWNDAALGLTAALRRAPRNPLYRGDLAFMVARTGNLDSSATLYQQAYSLQQGNAWYLVGLAVVRAVQGRWADAAGTLTVAAQADSTVVDGRVAATAVAYFVQANDNQQAMQWARIAVVKAPDDATSWFLVATSYAERGDTTGLVAARRYRALRPNEPQGKLVMAHLLFLAGKPDSAIVLAQEVAPDTSFREAVAAVFLRVGERILRQRDIEGALAMFARGQAIGSVELREEFAFYVGSAQLVKLSRTLPNVEEQRNCDQARAAESLGVNVERNLREGASVDTARTNQFLTQILPGLQRQAAGFRETFCRPQPAGRQPARPRP